MRNLCNYTLNNNRLCKNYKFNSEYCYIHYVNKFPLLIILLTIFSLVITNYYMYIYFYENQSELYNDETNVIDYTLDFYNALLYEILA